MRVTPITVNPLLDKFLSPLLADPMIYLKIDDGLGQWCHQSFSKTSVSAQLHHRKLYSSSDPNFRIWLFGDDSLVPQILQVDRLVLTGENMFG